MGSATGVSVFFTTAMLAHRTLYEARPAPRYLTEFYLWMSFGGALGGMFTALIAPKLFTQIFEYPLLLALSMACRPGALRLRVDKEQRKEELIVLWLIADDRHARHPVAAGVGRLHCALPSQWGTGADRGPVPGAPS